MFGFNVEKIVLDEVKLNKMVKDKALKGTQESVNAAVGIAQMLVPVYTGHLRSTIKGVVTEDNSRGVIGVIGATASYARYVEEGTSKMPARPYLRPAVTAYKEYLMTAFLRGARG